MNSLMRGLIVFILCAIVIGIAVVGSLVVREPACLYYAPDTGACVPAVK